MLFVVLEMLGPTTSGGLFPAFFDGTKVQKKLKPPNFSATFFAEKVHKRNRPFCVVIVHKRDGSFCVLFRIIFTLIPLLDTAHVLVEAEDGAGEEE